MLKPKLIQFLRNLIQIPQNINLNQKGIRAQAFHLNEFKFQMVPVTNPIRIAIAMKIPKKILKEQMSISLIEKIYF